jgi:hypothetical protein
VLRGDRCTISCKGHTNFADKPICLLANNIQNEVVTIHRLQQMMKMLSLHMSTFLAPAEEILTYPLKLFCVNIYNFLTNIFFPSGVTVVNFDLRTTAEEKIPRIIIG